MIAKNTKPSAPKIIPEESESGGIGGDAIFGRCNFGEESVAELAAAFAVEILQS